MSVQIPLFEKTDSKPSTTAARAEGIVGASFDEGKFVENFELLADSEGGIGRLRGFILDLATRGLIAPQMSADGTAHDLLVKLRRARKRVDDGAVAEPAFNIPASWCWTTVGDVCSYVQRGKSPKYVETSSVPVVSQKCVQWEGFRIDRARFIDPASLDAYAEERFLREGDLLWNSTGHGTVGRVAVFRMDERYAKVVADSHVTVLRPEILPAFLWCWIASPTVQATIDELVSGTTKQTELATSTIVSHRVPLPPLDEQKRIVAKVNALMRLIDDLEAKQTKRRDTQARLRKAALEALTSAEEPSELGAAWERIATNFGVIFSDSDAIRDLRRTVVGLACRGALTCTEPGDGTGVEVMQRINSARKVWAQQAEREGNAEAGRILKKLDEQAPPSMLPLPTAWTTATLLDACCQLVDCHNKTAPYTNTGIMLVRTSNVRNGKIRVDGVKYVSEATYKLWSRRCPPAPADVLFTREAPMGEAGLIEDGMRLCMGQRMMLLRTFPELLRPKYLLLALQDPAFQDRMIRAAVGSTVKHLRVGDVESLVIPVPPIAEQKRIVAKVERLMKLCDDLEAKLQRAETTAAKLVEAVVAEMVRA